jgi:hypothetical protein
MSLQTRLSDLITAIGADQKRNHGVVTVASTATLTPAATSNQFNVTAQNAALAIAAPSGTMADGQGILIRIKDNGTARAISWDAVYRAVGVTLPLTTVLGKVLYIGGKYNAAESVVDVIAVGQQV